MDVQPSYFSCGNRDSYSWFSIKTFYELEQGTKVDTKHVTEEVTPPASLHLGLIVLENCLYFFYFQRMS